MYLLGLLLFKGGSLLLIEGECLLEPAKGASFLLQCLAGLIRRRRAVAHDAHAHARGDIPLVLLLVGGMARGHRMRGMRSLLQRRMGTGLHRPEELLVRV